MSAPLSTRHPNKARRHGLLRSIDDRAGQRKKCPRDIAMVQVKVRFFLSLITATGEREITLEIQDATVRSVLDAVDRRYGDRLDRPLINPETKGISPYYHVLVNGRNLRNIPGFLDAVLREGDVVQVFPPAAGG